MMVRGGGFRLSPPPVQCCILTSTHHQKAHPLSFKAPLRFIFHLSNHPAQPFSYADR